uniref:Uncharacterized protein n=1 Tax=Anguilla anguilla TaxID=7936 RepID=A0A0E9XPM9_ANGAN
MDSSPTGQKDSCSKWYSWGSRTFYHSM